jgi:hypothetical protein
MTEQPPASGNRWEPDADEPDTVPIRSEVDADTSAERDAEAEADAPAEPPTTYDATPAARRPWTGRVRPAVAGSAAAVVVIAGLGGFAIGRVAAGDNGGGDGQSQQVGFTNDGDGDGRAFGDRDSGGPGGRGFGEGTSGQTIPPGTGPDVQPGQDDDPASSDGSET